MSGTAARIDDDDEQPWSVVVRDRATILLVRGAEVKIHFRDGREL